MSEYIDREAAYEVLTEYYHHSTEFQHLALKDALARVPAADVVERKKSFWRRDAISTNDGLSHVFGFRCYNCFGFCIGASKYCPNCGARMEAIIRQQNNT